MTVTIYHNPRCSKSRETLELLRGRGIEPEVVLYLETPPDAATLGRLLEMLGMEPRELMRTKEQPYSDLDLGNPERSRLELIDAMVAQPILVERPIVVRKGRAVLGRPPEAVLALL